MRGITNLGKSVAALAVLSIIVSPAVGKVVFVDANAPGANDGSSWTDAYNYLQDALMYVSAGDQIRVAQGLYKPDEFVLSDRPSLGREETFGLISGVALNGGYAGSGEPDPNARDIALYETILSGDIDGDGERNSGNSYHVIEGANNVTLEGFIIEHGFANGGGDWQFGGGMFNLQCLGTEGVNVIDCTFRDNYADGGGAMCNRQISNVRVLGCTFIDNEADWAGAMYNSSASVVEVVDCTFERNTALAISWGEAGAIANQQCFATFENCLFAENSADGYSGGAMNNKACGAGWPILTNCLFRENTAIGYGGAMHNYRTSPTLEGCLFSGNRAIAYDGGAMDNYNRCDPTLTSCVFRDNSAGRSGGVMANDGYCDPVFVNCAFSGNRADDYAGGIYSYQGNDPVLVSCTLTGNRPGALDGTSSIATLSNCVLWNNIPYQVGTTAQISYTCIQGNWFGQGNIDADPCFADPGYWNDNGTPEDPDDDLWVDGEHHLKSQAGRYDPDNGSWILDDVTSPCVDAGDPLDPVGPEPFPNGGRLNMGAYGGTVEGSKSYFGKPLCQTIVAGDINGDCEINFKDFYFVALHWLTDNNP